MNLQEQISRIKEMMSINPNEKVYDYQEGRNTVPERLPFDINKLVNSGVVFVTPAIDGDPNSKTYKEWLEEPGSHLITLLNVIKSSKNGWIRKAITKRASTKDWKSNFVDNIYDGKYNQILWSLEKLGIDPMDMLIDGETGGINESDPKVGTGKKPEGSDRRLYTDENPKDTVSVKFKTKQDIIDTLSKESFKSKSHARQSQIINLIHQRLRVALERAKDPEVKKRLRTAFEYIKSKKEESKRKTEEMKEGELTEKCWAGYTQKGMKTMFGKRYPNCVKKTK
jgi:hypothetical protein